MFECLHAGSDQMVGRSVEMHLEMHYITPEGIRRSAIVKKIVYNIFSTNGDNK